MILAAFPGPAWKIENKRVQQGCPTFLPSHCTEFLTAFLSFDILHYQHLQIEIECLYRIGLVNCLNIMTGIVKKELPAAHPNTRQA